jgi:hypothetical protein
MPRRNVPTFWYVIGTASCVMPLLVAANRIRYTPPIPTAWVQTELEQMDVPVSEPQYSPKPVSPEYYYRIPVTPIYKSYPVYAPGRAPAGYMENLKRLAPRLAFDASRLRTREEWVRAGEIVFDAATAYGAVVNIDDLANPEWYAATGIPIAKDGTIPWVRYVIRGTGNVEVGNLSCGFCHTRVLADGSVVKGAQSNFPVDKSVAYRNRRRGTPDQIRED